MDKIHESELLLLKLQNRKPHIEQSRIVNISKSVNEVQVIAKIILNKSGYEK